MKTLLDKHALFLGNESQLLLNPRLSTHEQDLLKDLYRRFADFPSHVWIASSGSAQKIAESKKLYALSKKAILASAKAANEHLQVTHRDRWLNVLPHFHVGGLGIHARAFLSDSSVVDLTENPWSPLEFTQSCQSQQITLSSLVPTQVFDLVSLQLRAPESVRAIVVGGAALSPELYRRARALGWRLLPSFGMTEFCSQIATADLLSLTQTEFPKALKILNHVQIKIGQNGCLAIDGASKFTGFAQDLAGEKKWTQGPLGAFETSDRGEILDGFLIPLGRGVEFVKIKGEGVSLLWLREKLFELSSKEHVTLIALPDSRDGAKLVLVGEETKDSLQMIASEYNKQSSPYERVSCVVHVPRMPRTELGKIRWEELAVTVSEQVERGDVLLL